MPSPYREFTSEDPICNPDAGRPTGPPASGHTLMTIAGELEDLKIGSAKLTDKIAAGAV
jgi:hypothetical protein